MKTWIKLSFVLFFALPLLFTSCEKDEETAGLVGTWEYFESEDGMTMSISITFNSDNSGELTFIMTFDGETETETGNFTWSTEGATLTITEEGETNTLKYSISDNKLTITPNGEDSMVFTRK